LDGVLLFGYCHEQLKLLYTATHLTTIEQSSISIIFFSGKCFLFIKTIEVAEDGEWVYDIIISVPSVFSVVKKRLKENIFFIYENHRGHREHRKKFLSSLVDLNHEKGSGMIKNHVPRTILLTQSPKK